MSELSVHDVLVRARALIEREEDWWNGGSGSVGDLCAGLAVEKVTSCDNDLTLSVCRVLMPNGLPEVVDFNDSHSHEEVLGMFDKAIAAEAPEPPDPEDFFGFDLILTDPGDLIPA